MAVFSSYKDRNFSFRIAASMKVEITPTVPSTIALSFLSSIVDKKDKPNAEGTVGVIETWILAALRNRKFFCFEELNRAIYEKLQEFNEKPFQKKKGSRLTAFEEEEKPFLMPLPTSPYETAIWSKATIHPIIS